MKIFEALAQELKRLESLSYEQFNHEMKTNEDFGILVFAAKDELDLIAYASIQVSVWEKDVEDKDRVNAIIERILTSVDNPAV
jgi:hypothetical protein